MEIESPQLWREDWVEKRKRKADNSMNRYIHVIHSLLGDYILYIIVHHGNCQAAKLIL